MDIQALDKYMAVKDPEKDLYWYKAEELTVEGKGWQNVKEFYNRLPEKAEAIVRPPVWSLSRNTAGIAIRFVTDSPSLAVQWDGNSAMDHMPATGVSGVDLYVKHNGRWRWLAIGRPVKELNEVELFEDLPVEEREFMLYLPLYNTVSILNLGLPEGYELKKAPVRQQKPIAFYGTSITQGGCASRAGMCYTAILGRWLDMETINLGFSGNGIMEPEVIDLLCELDPVMFVLDNMPNMEEPDINERLEQAVRKLRRARPETPIVLIDNMLYCDAFLKPERMARYQSSNKAQFAIYEKLIADGMTNLHYIKDEQLIGDDDEATVDGVHFTDLGYMRFAEALFKPLNMILNG